MVWIPRISCDGHGVRRRSPGRDRRPAHPAIQKPVDLGENRRPGYLGVPGAMLVVMAVTIFIGGALFALRLMPGPAFSVGVVATSVVALAVQRRMDGLRLIPPLPFPRRLDPLVLLGIVACAAGAGIAIYAAWIIDVAGVHATLRAVG